MEVLKIGEVIRDARIRHGLTQEELAFGICAVSTLSRIENGRHNPQNRVFEALMERMGEQSGRCMMFVGPRTMERKKLQEELAQAVRCGDRRSLEQILQRYRIFSGEKENEDYEDQQWMELAEQVLEWWNGTTLEQAENELLNILYLTYPDYDGELEALRDYNACEILIFQLLTACQEQKMELALCQRQLERMLQVLNRKNGEQIWQKQARISVCYQMAALCLMIEEYPGSVRYGRDGLALCRQTNSYQSAPMLLSVLATGMTKLGDTKKAGQAERYACMVDEMLVVKNKLQIFIEDIL